MPATAARADLESLLRTRKLDHTLTTARPAFEPAAGDLLRWAVPTGLPELDARLQGGFPRGHLSEVAGPRSSGRLTAMVSAMASATRRGEAVALIDPLDMFDPVSAAASGVDFERMLWVRGEASSATRVSLSCEYGTLQNTLDRGIKALNLVLQAGGFGLVALDVAEISPVALKRLPFTTWLRLHRVIEGSETACVIIGQEPTARSAGGLTVQLGQTPVGAGTDVAGGFSRPAINARVIRARAVEVDRHVRLPVAAPAC